MEGSRGIVYAFGVGLANFAAGRSRLPRQIAADVADVLPLIAWYGATGNLALAAGECVDVAQRLAEITGTAWAVIPAGDLAAALGALEGQPAPRVPAGIRATPGLAFAVEPARPGLIRSIPEAALRRLNDRIVLVHKFDVLAGNRLDRARRRGGWGQVSAAVAGQVGGRWTARSHRPLAALRARAEHRLECGGSIASPARPGCCPEIACGDAKKAEGGITFPALISAGRPVTLADTQFSRIRASEMSAGSGRSGRLCRLGPLLGLARTTGSTSGGSVGKKFSPQSLIMRGR